MCGNHQEKKQYARQIIYINWGHLSVKFTLDIDLTDKLVVQYDVPIVKNTFADDCKC